MIRGSKQYELTNHLGNVLATVTDNKVAIDGKYEYKGSNGNYNYTANGFELASPAGSGKYTQMEAPDAQVDYFLANIVNSQDYFAFGMEMPEGT